MGNSQEAKGSSRESYTKEVHVVRDKGLTREENNRKSLRVGGR